jgi:hypothetical protein
MSADSSVVVSDFCVNMWFDSTNLPNGFISQYPDITPGPDEIVYDVIKKYLEDHGLSLNDVIVFYGMPADGKYSCMGWERRHYTFGDDRFRYNQGDTMTIGLRARTGESSAEDLKVKVLFVDDDLDDEGSNVEVFQSWSYCFELLQRVFLLAVSHFNMEIEDVTFKNRGNAVDGATMTAHELFPNDDGVPGRIRVIRVKFNRPTVEVRVVYDDCVFRHMCTESPLRIIKSMLTKMATSRGLIIEACTFSICNWLMTTFREVREATRLTDIQLFPFATRHVLCITGGSKRDLEKLAVDAAVQAAGHKRALEAHEQRARILEAQKDRDMHAHEHTVDFARRHYEDALRFQKRVNEINAMQVSDQAKLVADAAASLEKSERKRARFEAVLATIEEEPVAPAAVSRVETRVEIGACSVCFNERYLGDSIMLFVPCGHTVCVNCIPPVMALEVCPICRVEIRTTQAAFL